MSNSSLDSFLKALETVKNDLTCSFCFKLCVKPVTLSKCFHIICSDHFEGLKSCPKCDVSLENCTTFFDKDLEVTIKSTNALDEMFKPLRKDKENVDTNAANSSGPEPNRRRRIKKVEKKDDSKEVTSKKTNKSDISKELEVPSKNMPKKATKSESDNLNTSRLSNISSKFSKTLEKKNNKGETALHVACRLGKVDKVVELLNQGANTNTKDNAGWTPLHEVVQTGRLDLVKLLLQHNTLINVPGQSNETPLHEAVRYQHIEIIKELISNGADINIRNIKGETPLQLAKGNIRNIIESSLDDIIQTQTVNITHISNIHSELDYEDIRVFYVSHSKTLNIKLKALTKHHNNLHIETKFTKKVTHLIVDSEELLCTSTLDVLHAITNELWVISSDWINKSTEKKLESFNDYEIEGVGKNTHNGPKTARYNKYKQLPRLFNGCHFYLHNFNTNYEISKKIVLNKTILSKLITDAGGIVLRRVPNPELIPESEKLVPYHAKKDGLLVNCSHYILFKDIYEPRYNMQHLKALPVGWLIECIERYELCDP